MSTQKPKTSKEIIPEILSKLEMAKEHAIKAKDNLNAILVKSNELGQLDNITIDGIKDKITALKQRNIETKLMFFANHGKMTYEGPANEILGQFKIWKSKPEEVEKLQSALLDIFSINKESLDTLTKLLEFAPTQNKEK